MRNKFMITISDVHGSRQYTLHQLIGKMAIWVVVAIVVIIAVGAIFLKILSSKVDELDGLTKQLEHSKERLEKSKERLEVENKKLQLMKGILRKKISDKASELESMNEQLAEIEKIIGLEPDISDAFDDRVVAAKEKSIENVKRAQLSVAELSLLNRSVPTGSPLRHYKRISDGFGYRFHPILQKRVFHFGLDFSAKTGTPIYAPADGVVSFAKRKGGYGKFLLLNHPFGFQTAYGHLKKYAVKEGDYVQKGDLIAYVGNTGRSTGPHLHYEVRYLHKWMNPASFVKWSPRNYERIMHKERLVKWDKLFEQLRVRYNLKNMIAAK